MTLVHRILVPTDFSECAGHALEYAAELSVKLSAPLLLVHIYQPPVVYTPEGYVWATLPSEAQVRDDLMIGLGKQADVARARGAHVELAIATGGAWHEIIRLAEDRACDLVVMGTHGHSGLKHALLGSVAEKVVRKATCPVLTVAQRAKVQP
jgi:universal stress protein A